MPVEERSHDFDGGGSGHELTRSELHMYRRGWGEIRLMDKRAWAADVATVVKGRRHNIAEGYPVASFLFFF